jgi:L-serine deaminase
VLIAAQEEYGFSDREAVYGLLTASAIGGVVATRATLSGAAGGCQAECGTAAAMAAAALVEVMGGTPQQCTDAAALAKRERVDDVVETLRDKYGPGIIRNAVLLNNPKMPGGDVLKRQVIFKGM